MNTQWSEKTGQSHVINFQHHLDGKMRRSNMRKIERTRERIKLSAVRLLERLGYHNIRISTFCEEAGLAKGTFYLHFTDKEDLVAHVLEEYADLQVKIMPSAQGSENAYMALLMLNHWFAATFCENVGLHRSMMQLSETIPRITVIWTNFLKGLAARYIEEIHRWSNKPLNDDIATHVTYCLWGMLDQALYAIYAVHRNPDFERVAKDQAFLVESVTLFQYRALFLSNPDDATDKSLDALLALRAKK